MRPLLLGILPGSEDVLIFQCIVKRVFYWGFLLCTEMSPVHNVFVWVFGIFTMHRNAGFAKNASKQVIHFEAKRCGSMCPKRLQCIIFPVSSWYLYYAAKSWSRPQSPWSKQSRSKQHGAKTGAAFTFSPFPLACPPVSPNLYRHNENQKHRFFIKTNTMQF